VRTLIVATVLGGGLAHSTLAPVLRIGDVTPDLPLIVVVLLALHRGSEVGCLAGLVTGLLQDAASGGLLGVQALTKALVGFALGGAGRRLRVTQPLVQVPGLVLLSLAEGVARLGLMKLFHFPAAFDEVMTYTVLPQAVYNGFLGSIVVLALTWQEASRSDIP